ncbi:MAG: MATE family efflux transporter [Candidatus Dasytiphilus stammeri]
MQKYLVEVRQLLILAAPVILAQIAQTSINIVNTMMAGSRNPSEMAAVAIGTSIWLPVILFGYGLIMALTPIVAKLNGSGQYNRIPYYICQAYWLAIITSLLIMFVLHKASYLIDYMQYIHYIKNKKLAEQTIFYLHAMLYGVPGCLLLQVLRSQCEGLANTKPIMVISVLGLIVNISINYIIIHGKFGIPSIGGVGCGITTALVYWIMFITMSSWLRYFSSYSMKNMTRVTYLHLLQLKPDWTIISKLSNLGLPIALSLLFEVTLFTMVILLITHLGIITIASHQIALNFSGLIFVLQLSLSIATTIRVSFQLGRGSISNAHLSAKTAHYTGIILAIITACLTAFYRQKIAWLYNDNPQVIALAAKLMLFAALYQISDSIQIIGSGILRAYQDTSSISLITFISFWLIGLPCGYILGLTNWIVNPLGVTGFWIGFIIGLTASAIMMILRIRNVQSLLEKNILQREDD